MFCGSGTADFHGFSLIFMDFECSVAPGAAVSESQRVQVQKPRSFGIPNYANLNIDMFSCIICVRLFAPSPNNQMCLLLSRVCVIQDISNLVRHDNSRREQKTLQKQKHGM